LPHNILLPWLEMSLQTPSPTIWVWGSPTTVDLLELVVRASMDICMLGSTIRMVWLCCVHRTCQTSLWSCMKGVTCPRVCEEVSAELCHIHDYHWVKVEGLGWNGLELWANMLPAHGESGLRLVWMYEKKMRVLYCTSVLVRGATRSQCNFLHGSSNVGVYNLRATGCCKSITQITMYACAAACKIADGEAVVDESTLKWYVRDEDRRCLIQPC
jgi:hypothetical protein